MTKSELTKESNKRDELIASLLDSLETRVNRAQTALYTKLLNEVFEKLDLDENRIKRTQKNKRLLNAIDRVFNEFGKTEGIRIANELINGIGELIAFNQTYFSLVIGNIEESELIEFTDVLKSDISSWLGIENGKVVQNGYIDKILQHNEVRQSVKDLLLKDVISQKGYFDTRKQFEQLIKGIPQEKKGKLNQYYRQFTFDTYSQVDGMVSLELANKHKLNFALYAGGLVRDSRPFCQQRNGKVFHRSEIERFNPTTAKPPNYNPFIQMGGYNCRHQLNWISDDLARLYREDVDTLINL